MKKQLLTLACATAFVAAAHAADPKENHNKPAQVPADNSAVNQRNEPVADDQAMGTKADVELTRRIRAELTKDTALSINAKNVKIITVDGVTTLRGPVNSQQEKARIGEIARTITGKAATNNIEILKK